MSGAPEKRPGAFAALTKFIGLSAVAGVLATSFLTPALTVGSFVVQSALTAFDELPTYLEPVNASEASSIYANRNGQPVKVATFYNENRISVPFEEISPYAIDAVIATEDPRFYQHAGVDWISLVRAAAQNAVNPGGGPGASTITMQYVRNNLIEAANISGDKTAIDEARAISFTRKLKEIRYALALEQRVSKKDILAGYLNLAFFGNQINGIEAAANYYFGKTAKDLNLQESALLAAMLKSPNDYKPDDPENLERAKGRRDYVIQNMVGPYITQQEADVAKAAPIEVKITEAPSGCEANQVTAFFCDFTVWTIRNSVEFGANQEDRENLLRRGGLEIYTTLDLDVQKAADKASKKWVPYDNQWGIGTATVSVKAGTGEILAMAVNRVFDQTQSDKIGHTAVNYASDKAYGGSSGFQSGSTYKIFTLAQWLIQGKKLEDHVDARIREWNATDFSSRCGSLTGTWKPKNSEKDPEDMSVVQATARSVNSAFAAMAAQLDLCDIRDTAMAFGVRRADGNPLISYPASILGVNELSPLTMAAAVAAVANKGVYCSPIAIKQVIVRKNQQSLTVPTSICNQAVAPEIAAGMTYAMQRVISGGTGGASATGDGTPLAGKTGTTDSGLQTWMTGFSSQVGTATWVGNPVGQQSLWNIRFNNKAANTVRHDIWRTTMQKVNELYPGGPLEKPPVDMITATYVTVPDVATQDPTAAAEVIKTNDLSAAIQTKGVVSTKPKGTVAYTKPRAGDAVPRGTQIKIYVSKGGSIVVPDVAGMSVEQAISTLTAAGFPAASVPQPSQGQYFQHSSTVAKDFVIGTNPPAGSSSIASAAILLIISLGP